MAKSGDLRPILLFWQNRVIFARFYKGFGDYNIFNEIFARFIILQKSGDLRLLFFFLMLHYLMNEFLNNFVMSAKSGYIFFGYGHEYTFEELFEIVFAFLF